MLRSRTFRTRFCPDPTDPSLSDDQQKSASINVQAVEGDPGDHDPLAGQSRKSFPKLGDGWTNVEWTILEHTHDHIRDLGEESPDSVDAMKLAKAFLEIYENSEFRIKAEEQGMEHKEFSKEEVRDRIIALRQTRDRRKSGDLAPAKKLDDLRDGGKKGPRLSGLLNLAKFW
jgi:hypothetical protein